MPQKGKDIADELKQVSPGLPDMGETPAYGLPYEYFDKFPDALMDRVRNLAAEEEVTEELMEIAPILASIPRKTAPFFTPHGYFKGLDRQLIQGSGNEPATKVIPIGRKIRLFKRCLAAAAIAGVVVVSAIWGVREWTGNSIDRRMAQISDQEIVDFLQYRSDDFDDENIFANVSLEAGMPSVLPEGLSIEEIDLMLEDNLLQQTQLNN
ncbi:hypothetical protein [Chitinophaga sp.]|uniref:hypothetical protein n=1 Tax=Chitinophaga sp. TaxID=1869181 RepID=UPI002611B7B8|nr:hypothetical protein [uncultured Chitinophaga sp.]